MFWLKFFFRRSTTSDTAFVVRHTHAGARNPNPWCLLPCVGWLMTPSLLPITPVFSGYLSGYVLILKSFYFSLKFFIVLKKRLPVWPTSALWSSLSGLRALWDFRFVPKCWTQTFNGTVSRFTGLTIRKLRAAQSVETFTPNISLCW